ncbi:MAG: oxaloacetate-decarboxylating malate dehydrogenase [Sandaracinaceae bacterium]|nr:oxaloacetate-decarboxylating malate dehydrogenase [Sandaracinaceae bacterium]
MHPTQTLPISLDVGTDNEALLDDPYYLGWRGRRLRGERYDRIVEEFVTAVKEVFPRALLQWEDFKKANAFRLLDRYRDRLLSFNDDIQGTAGIALAGVVAASRISGVPMERQRVVMVGAGAAGVGIARLLRAELEQLGVRGDDLIRAVAVLDSRGLLVESGGAADYKSELAWPADLAASEGVDPSGARSLLECVTALKPTVLIGTSGQPNTFTEDVVRAMAACCERPAIFPFSNPNSKAEAHPRDLVAWTDGRALIASGSPSTPSPTAAASSGSRRATTSTSSPGVGLGALASGATRVVESMFAAAAHAIGEQVSEEAIARGELYPPLRELRPSRAPWRSRSARTRWTWSVAPRIDESELAERIDAMMWTPRYPRIRLPGAGRK